MAATTLSIDTPRPGRFGRGSPVKRVTAAVLLLFGLMFATGYGLLQLPKMVLLAAIAAVGFLWLRGLNRKARKKVAG